MAKVKAKWTGFSGAPGYSNFFFREWTDGTHVVTPTEATACIDKVRAFFEAVKGTLPPIVRIQVDPEVEEIEETNGQIQGIVAGAVRPVTAGSNANGAYSAASGAVCTWLTSGVRNGRRVRGRTFLVPLSAAVYDIDGTFIASHLTTLQSAATGLVTDDANTPTFGVYARPTAVGANDGVWTVANAARVPDMAAILRSRRD